MGIVKSTGYLSDLAKNIHKAVFKFSLDIKKAVSFYLEFEKVSVDRSIKTEQEFKNKIDSIQRQSPMVKVRIERINSYEYFKNNGHINEKGNFTRKDSLVHVKDSAEIQKKQKEINDKFKKRQWNKFQNKN